MTDLTPDGNTLTRPRRRALARRRKKLLARAARLAPAGAALVLGAAGLAGRAEAATFTVANLNDSGAGSLRQALQDANGAAGPDVVDFQAGLTGTLTLTTGQLDISDSVDVQGPGAGVLSVSGNASSRVFYLYSDSETLEATISGLTVTGGSAAQGAGIANQGEHLTLNQVAVTGNTATANGGGVWSGGLYSQLTVTASTITGNDASSGAGIFVDQAGAPTLVQDTGITGNDASTSGGGVHLNNPQESVTFERCTIAGNTSGEGGGGLVLSDPDGGIFNLRDSTISGNEASSGGGAVLDAPYSNLLLVNDTISGNQATGGPAGGLGLHNQYGGISVQSTTIAGNGAKGEGGGIYLYGGRAMLENTIVADGSAVANPDLAGPGTFDLFFTLVETPGTASIGDNGGNLFNQDPQLEALGSHGGPTEVRRPGAASPAVNAGDPSFTPSPSTDQRGAGFPRVSGGRIDMGSVELSPGIVQLALTAVSVDEDAGTVTITATRTGGTDGAVGATYTTVDGTAMSPADFLAAMGTFNWADGDGAPKSIQVTIVNDDVPNEGNENFLVVLSAPTGGAALGSEITEEVTIADDDAPGVAEVPTLGEVGRLLLAGLLGAAGLSALRRRKAGA